MTPAEHYRQAEICLNYSKTLDDRSLRLEELQLALVHAVLATAPAPTDGNDE